MDKIGGLENIRSNFDYSKIPKKLPKYYKNCFEAFAKFVNKVPASKQELLIQPIWNNVNIKQEKQSFYFRELDQVGIKSIRDIWSKNTKKFKCLSSFVDPKSSAYVKYFLSWVSIIKSIPIAWTLLLKDDDSLVNSELNMENSILCFSGEMLKLTEMTSKKIFTIYCESEALQSKGEVKFNNLMEK